LTAHGTRIDRVRSFGMSDELERLDQLVPVVYPRSLLYFVSGVLEAEADAPLVGMERFYATDGPFAADKLPDVETVRHHLGADGRSVWSISDAAGGLASGSTSHGGFDDDPSTLKSVQQFVRGT
jgi:hypothetical protein